MANMFKRAAQKKLEIWRKSEFRKPLIIRGARQVGKTTLVREFSKQFNSYIELNLEKNEDRSLFKLQDVNQILEAAALLKNVGRDNASTLVFIDEIQESPEAIQLLRYFYEEAPSVYLIAAGSLLEFALKDIASFPVGRVEFLYLHPVNFEEYLEISSNTQALNVFEEVPSQKYAHPIMLKHFHEYALIGGMPELIKRYLKTMSISNLATSYIQLWESYKADVEKYAKNSTERKVIQHIIDSAAYESDRIKFEGFGKSNYRSREVAEAIRSLDLAKLIRTLRPTTSVALPIQNDLRKRPRLQFLDTGLWLQTLSLQKDMIGIGDLTTLFKGKVIESYIRQELISIHNEFDFKPNFWVRESKTSNSELDIVYPYKNYLIPIEVKSGKQGTLRSLHQFMDRSEHPYAIRMYAGEFSIEEAQTIKGTKYFLMNLPYYLGTQIEKYLAYFIKNYKEL
jgi:hypothetical protein